MPDTYDAHKSTTEVRQGSRTLDNFLGADHFGDRRGGDLYAIIFLVFFVNTPPSAISP